MASLLLFAGIVLLLAGVVSLLGAPIPVNGWYCILAAIIILAFYTVYGGSIHGT